jgi:hypothetical protein
MVEKAACHEFDHRPQCGVAEKGGMDGVYSCVVRSDVVENARVVGIVHQPAPAKRAEAGARHPRHDEQRRAAELPAVILEKHAGNGDVREAGDGAHRGDLDGHQIVLV